MIGVLLFLLLITLTGGFLLLRRTRQRQQWEAHAASSSGPRQLTARQLERIFPLHLELEILYRRTGQKFPERRQFTSDVLRIWQDTAGRRLTLIEGVCHKRRAPRRFRCENIFELRDMSTGETVIGPQAVVAWIERRAAGQAVQPVTEAC